mgnify:CR=1 FL=1
MSVSTEERFKQNFLTLVEICEEMVEDGNSLGHSQLTPLMFSVIRIVVGRLEGKFLLERFIRKTHQHWGKIKEKDLEYFKTKGIELFNMAEEKGIDGMVDSDEKGITSGLSLSHISSFKELLSIKYKDSAGNEVSIFDDDRVDMTWRILHSFVKQSISYIHETRAMVDGEYTKDYFPNINVKENAQQWNIKKIAQ